VREGAGVDGWGRGVAVFVSFMKFPWTKKISGTEGTRSLPATMGKLIRSPRAMPEHAKILRQTNERMLRMYEAAVSNNLNADFPVTISSANAELFTSIMPTRSRARTLERDNPYAWAMLESIRVNVGGHEPFRLEMKVGSKTPDGEFIEERETNEMIQEAWVEAGKPKNCTTRRDTSRLELDLQAITAMVRDGGILARHWRGFPKNKFRYALQPLEIDRLDHYWNGKNPENGNDIKLSVELDQWGGPEAFWLLTKHPGDIFQIGNLRDRYRERVVSEDMIALFDIRTRAEQLVATSRFASIIQRLHRVDQFDIAHVTAAIWASCKPFFITQEFPTAMEYVPDFIKTAMQNAMAGDAQNEGDKISNVEPGTGEILPYGQKPVLVDPKFPIEAASGFKKDNLRAAAAGSGTAYHMIANDLEGVNFSSGRLGENQFHDTCKITQEHFIESYRRPHFEEWLKSAILSGQVDLPMSRLEEFCTAAKFHGRRWPYVNPLQDAQADILRIEAGLDSRDNVIQNSERGGDVEQVNAEIASGQTSDDAHGLDFTNDPTTPTLKKGEVGEELPAPEAATAAKKTGGKQTIKKGRTRKVVERFVRMNKELNGHGG
jgi:lambda family phage portal protein